MVNFCIQRPSYFPVLHHAANGVENYFVQKFCVILNLQENESPL